MKSTITMVMIAGIMFFGFEGFAKTHAAAQNQQKKSTLGVAVCAKAGTVVTGKVCVGTGGITFGTGAGPVVQVTKSTTLGWDKSVTTCTGLSAGGGSALYGTGGGSACLKNGKPVIQQTGGIGAGVGTDGAGAAVYVQVSRTTPLTKTSGGAR